MRVVLPLMCRGMTAEGCMQRRLSLCVASFIHNGEDSESTPYCAPYDVVGLRHLGAVSVMPDRRLLAITPTYMVRWRQADSA